MTKEIDLAGRARAIVDDKDYEALSQHKWCLFNGYAGRYEGGRLVLMHRLINGTPKGVTTDHINCNKLDNRRANLRDATSSQNSMNRPTVRCGAKVKGAWFDRSAKGRKKWRSSIEISGVKRYLGYFLTEEEAAAAYAQAAQDAQGTFAHSSTQKSKDD